MKHLACKIPWNTLTYCTLYLGIYPSFHVRIIHSCQHEWGQWVLFALPLLRALTCSPTCGCMNLAQGGPHSAMKLISLSLHTNPAVLSMQMREEKRGGLSWVCSVSASLLLHFKWINDKSALFSQSVTLSPSLSLSLSLSLPLSLSLSHSLPHSLRPSSHPSSHSEFTVTFPWLHAYSPSFESKVAYA